MLRRLVLPFWAMTATLLMVSGVARAEVLIGAESPDWLVGTVNDDRISGLGGDVVSGDDNVNEGPPFDASHDKVYGGAGNDVVDTFNNPAVAGLSSCGPGSDIAYADEKDIVANDCEKIVRGPEPTSDALIAFPRPPGPGYPVWAAAMLNA